MKYVGSIYNLVSERADLRSWQTLPAHIHIARLFVEPGEYALVVGREDLGMVRLAAGEKKFFVVRTAR